MTNKERCEELSYKRLNVYEEISADERAEMEELCKSYRAFLDDGKTERECVETAEKAATENGFKPLESVDTLKAGDKVYVINRRKNIALFVIGKAGIDKGINMVGAHIDSPRLDLKQNPLYESEGTALLKTHYYGGIKKYQWTTIPLAMHGVVHTANGECVKLSVGENDDDPIFCITDLLPHLATEQMQKKMMSAVEGEALNILFGGEPIKDEDIKERVKYHVLTLLNDKYGIREKDFLNAEIEFVPAFKAREVGLDRSFIGAYGQDDRVCAYTALRAILDMDYVPEVTACCLLVDKEEIGSAGNTGMLSDFYAMTVAELIEKCTGSCTMTLYNKVMRNSECLSSDVGAAFDPNYPNVSEKNNAAFAGGGMVLMKYTGSRGKSGSSDANSEFVYRITKQLDDKGVIWQTSELGKVDMGGGGTIAQYVANLNMDVIDCGVPLMSMHAPLEISAKGDVYMAYRTYAAFYELTRD